LLVSCFGRNQEQTRTLIRVREQGEYMWVVRQQAILIAPFSLSRVLTSLP